MCLRVCYGKKTKSKKPKTGLPKSLYVVFNNSKRQGVSLVYDTEHFGSLGSLQAAWRYDPQKNGELKQGG